MASTNLLSDEHIALATTGKALYSRLLARVVGVRGADMKGLEPFGV